MSIYASILTRSLFLLDIFSKMFSIDNSLDEFCSKEKERSGETG